MKGKKGRIGVVPLGLVPGPILEVVAEQSRLKLALEAEVLPALKDPAYALDERRKQYNAATIINRAESLGFDPCDKVIGIVNGDLYVPIFTHVLGQAREGGKFAIVSLYRLKRRADRSMAPMPLILNRVIKVALHELGHLFELGHCLDDACLMNFSGGLDDLDRIELHFCGYCNAFMADALRRHGMA
jgi:archaemetzincin